MEYRLLKILAKSLQESENSTTINEKESGTMEKKVIIPEGFYSYEITGERAEEAAKYFEEKESFIEHSVGYGHMDSSYEEQEKEDLVKQTREIFGVEIHIK